MQNSCPILPTIKKAVLDTLTGQYRHEAEDLVHDIYLKVMDKKNQFNAEKGDLEGWVYKISIHHVYDFFKRNKNSKSYELIENQLFIDEMEDIDEQHFDLLLSRVYEAIEAFTYEEKSILLDRYMNGVRDKELSEKIGIPANQIPMYRKRIRERLVRELSDYRLSA